VVTPAWWQTIYARILLVIALIVSGVFIGLFRVQLLKARQVKLEQLVDQQTVEIKRQRDAMALLATTDELTHLPNRRECSELLDREMARATRTGHPFSVFLFGVDLFKGINDENGHDVGDRVLTEIARVGQKVVRATDTLGRWGGDEFIILMPDTENAEAWEVCRRLREAIEGSTVKTDAGTVVKVTISGGISTYRSEKAGEPLSIGRFVRGADEALYRAKEDGRNRIA
jgi:diguanylate cyclase (GGDEF)-like protein